MTIAAGFVCSDGLVLAADRLYSGQSRRFGKKVWWFPVGDTVVAIAGAGLGPYIRHFKEEMRHRVQDGHSIREIIQHANDIVLPLQHRHHLAVPDEDWELDLLLGIRTPAACVLYENQNSHTFIPVEDEKQCRCIGCGNRIGVYLAEWLFDSSLTTQWATTIAAHVLTQAIAGDPDCGGKRDILVIPSVLDQTPYEVDLVAINALTEQLSKIEKAVRDMLVYAPGSNLNEETKELRFKALDDAVRAARNVTIRLTGVAALTITGSPATLTVKRRDGTIEEDSGS